MSGYTLNNAAAFTSLSAGGGNMTPAMPVFLNGDLFILHTGVNTISSSPPVISGWTKLTNNTGVTGDAAYGRIAVSGDTSPTFQWDASHQAFSRIVSFTGSVYTDLTTIVDIYNDHGTGTQNPPAIVVGATAAPLNINDLVLRGGHCTKTATSNGSTFNDWATDSGVYTKIGNTQLVQNNNALAAGLWFWQQSSAATTSIDSASLSIADTSSNAQAWTLVLRSLPPPPPPPTAVIPSRLIFILP